MNSTQWAAITIFLVLPITTITGMALYPAQPFNMLDVVMYGIAWTGIVAWFDTGITLRFD